jgi:WD40 repeat protein
MADPEIKVKIEGGSFQGVVAQSVVIENLTFYASPLPAEPPEAADDGTIPPCPYPGLAYFGPQDSGLFFGREAAIARLKTAVTRRSLSALVGASGSGKSSVVLAGLAPRLNADGGWRFTHFRVGTEQDKNPFVALARALVPLYGDHGAVERLEEVEKLADKLGSGALQFSSVLGACLAHEPGKRVLLIADQFEELFTLGIDEPTRRRFIDVLLAGFPERGDSGAPNMCLVMTMRADFYGVALRHRPLADALQGHVENLGPMTREELREAIVRPAGTVKFEGGLVETLLDDVTRRPGSLPLLQFALREMWGRQQKRCITRASYDAIGGVEGALAQRAQAIFEAATAKGEDAKQARLFRRLFTRLVTPGEGAEDTRRVVGREELGPETWQLAQRLADEGNRLVVTSAPTPDHETAEVVHEALIRNWPTLIDWINRDRAFQLWLRQLRPRVEEWLKSPSDEGAFLRGGALAQAEEFLARRGDELSDEEKAYIDACSKARLAREASLKEEQERRLRDAERIAEEQKKVASAQKRAKWLTIVVSAATVVIVAAVGLAYYLNARQTQFASLLTSRQWSAQSRLDLDVQAPRNLLLAINAISLNRRLGAFSITESRKLLGDLLDATGGVPLPHAAQIDSVALSPNGRWLAAANGGEVALRDLQAPGAAPIALRASEKNNKVAFSPDGNTLAAVGSDGTLRLWTMTANDPAASLRALRAHRGAILDVAFSPDNRWLATGGEDNTARLWDLSSPRVTSVALSPPRRPNHQIRSVAFSDDKRWLATASAQDYAHTTVSLWDVSGSSPSAQPTNVDLGKADVRKLAFSPDSAWLAGGATETYQVVLMRVAAPDKPIFLPINQWVGNLAFSPDGHWLATPGHYAAFLWDLTKPDPSVDPLMLGGHKGGLIDLAFSRSGQWLATGADDHTVRLWDMKTFFPPTAVVLRGHEGRISGLAFSEDGNRLVTASYDRTVRVWNTSSPTAEPRTLRTDGGSTKLHIWDLSDVSAPPRVLGDDLLQGAGSVFSPDGKWLAVIPRNNITFVHLWSLSTSPTKYVLDYPGEVWATPVFTPDGRWLVTAGVEDATIKMWDLTKPDPTNAPRQLGGHRDAVRSLAISADGRRLISGGDDGTILWDLTAANPQASARRLQDQVGTIRAVAISNDGRYVATGSWQPHNAVHIWDLSRPDAEPRKIAFGNRLFDVSFSPDGRWFAAASWDLTAQLLDLTKPGAQPLVLKGHTARVFSVAFSPDSQWLATGGEDLSARLWSLSAPDPSTEAIALSAPFSVGNVSFSPDGRWLSLNQTEQRARPFSPEGRWFASSDSDARLYSVRLDDLVQLACRTAGRELTEDEVQKGGPLLNARICRPELVGRSK